MSLISFWISSLVILLYFCDTVITRYVQPRENNFISRLTNDEPFEKFGDEFNFGFFGGSGNILPIEVFSVLKNRGFRGNFDKRVTANEINNLLKNAWLG